MGKFREDVEGPFIVYGDELYAKEFKTKTGKNSGKVAFVTSPESSNSKRQIKKEKLLENFSKVKKKKTKKGKKEKYINNR